MSDRTLVIGTAEVVASGVRPDGELAGPFLSFDRTFPTVGGPLA